MQTTSVLKVRSGPDPASDPMMNLPKGSVLIIVESVEQPDKSVRGLIQLTEAMEPLGWITTLKADGSSSLVKAEVTEIKPAADAHPSSMKKLATYETGAVLKVRKESDPKSDLVTEGLKAGNLPKGSLISVMKRELQPDKSERGQIKFSDQPDPLGWITTIKADGTSNLTEKKEEVQAVVAAATPSGGGGGAGAGGGAPGEKPGKKTKEYVKPKVDLHPSTVKEQLAQELHRQMKPTLDKNGLIVHPSAIKRKVDQKDDASQKSRHDEAPPLEVDDGIKLMFNMCLAPFRVATAKGGDEQVPENDIFHIYARNGKPIGKVKIPPNKGQPLEDRVSFESQWLDGEVYGLNHLAAQGQAIIEVNIKIDDKTQIALIVSPWLAYSCSCGSRFLIRKFGETSGRIGTVKRVMNDDRVVIHIDGTDAKDVSSLITIEARPDTVVKSKPVRHKVGTAILLLQAPNPASAACVDAVVAEIPMDKWKDGSQILDAEGFRVPDGVWGSRHWLQLRSSASLVEADLNEYNHAIQRFGTKDEYEAVRVEHCQQIVEKNSQVEDAITGNTLNIKDQLVKVDVKASSQGATNRLLGRAVSDVATLTDILLTPSPRRSSGEHPMQPLLMRAGPGTGKTWMCKQAVWMLAERYAASHLMQSPLPARSIIPRNPLLSA